MITLRKPTPNVMRRYLAKQAELAFTYAEVGGTATTPPARFTVDHARVELGAGEGAFEAAQRALTQWKHFELGWVQEWPPDAPLQTGETVAVVIRACGLWWLNAARIVYVVNESSDSKNRFGFAYGTLPGHAEIGEERFIVEWDRSSNAVAYEILAFSRPRHLLARLGGPLVRRLQKRFARDSAAAMVRAVMSSSPYE